jgi:two-component system CheB/CheR fusion protein
MAKTTKKSAKAAMRPKAVVKRKQGRPVSAKAEADNFYIVGIGASAGGLEAFEKFFTNMPADSGMAFVLIPHLSPEHKSIMSDLMKRYTKMEVFQAEDGVEVKPDCLYIIPPNKDMALMGRRLQLLDPVERKGFRHPIDFFFRSLAEDLGEKAICVVLSGTGTEGALGLRSVKEKGGLALVQEPKAAAVWSFDLYRTPALPEGPVKREGLPSIISTARPANTWSLPRESRA